MHHLCASSLRGHKRTLDSLYLVLQEAVRCQPWVLGNEAGSSKRAANLLTIFPDQVCSILDADGHNCLGSHLQKVGAVIRPGYNYFQHKDSQHFAFMYDGKDSNSTSSEMQEIFTTYLI